MDVPLMRNWQIHPLANEKDPNISQPDIRKSADSSAKGVYLKMMKIAWEMALMPSMPHKHFSVLVKCQKDQWSASFCGKG